MQRIGLARTMPHCFSTCAFIARVGVALLVVLAAAGSIACKKERVEKTRFVPIGGPGCERKRLPEGAIISTEGFGGAAHTWRRIVVYPDGHIVSTRLVFDFHDHPPRRTEVDDPPSSMSPARVKAFEAELEAAGLFALDQGCWIAANQGSDGGGRNTVVRHGSSSWSFAVAAWDDVPPAAMKAASLESAFFEEAARAVDRDAATPGGATDSGGP
jgi:hypothetical protein